MAGISSMQKVCGQYVNMPLGLTIDDHGKGPSDLFLTKQLMPGVGSTSVLPVSMGAPLLAFASLASNRSRRRITMVSHCASPSCGRPFRC